MFLINMIACAVWGFYIGGVGSGKGWSLGKTMLIGVGGSIPITLIIFLLGTKLGW